MRRSVRGAASDSRNAPQAWVYCASKWRRKSDRALRGAVLEMVKFKTPWRVTPKNRKLFPPLTPEELAVYMQSSPLVVRCATYASRVCVSEIDGLMYSVGDMWQLTQKGRGLVMAHVVVA